MHSDDPARDALAESAAQGLSVLPQLRLLSLAEALAAPAPARALELNTELDTLCTALQESVRRRPGWLYLQPAAQPAPVALPRQLLQAAVLCWIGAVLAAPSPTCILQLDVTAHAAILVLRGGAGRDLPSDTRALLLRLAAVCGGAVVQSGGSGPFTAALRLPLSVQTPLREAQFPAELLCDRYSVLQIFLQDHCAGPNE